MYIGHGRLCMCICVYLAACPHCCVDLDVTCGNGRGCALWLCTTEWICNLCTGFVAMTTWRQTRKSARACTPFVPGYNINSDGDGNNCIV